MMITDFQVACLLYFCYLNFGLLSLFDTLLSPAIGYPAGISLLCDT